MSKKIKIDSKEVGLVIGLIFGKYLLKSDYLHYGYWTDGLEVDIQNASRAQENYADFLASQIPEGAKSILDVGCGTGMFAKKLIGMGYKVDCVSPSGLLTDRARELLGDTSRIFECIYEDLETDNRYDLILFSESFQYVKIKEALDKSVSLLNGGGHVLISDFFRTGAKGKSLIGGGHKFLKFSDIISRYPLQRIKDIDITGEVSPSITIFNDFNMKVGLPIRDLIFYFLDHNHPLLSRFIKWNFKKRLDKIDRKYFSGKRNAEHFENFKTYRCLLYAMSNAP